MSSGGGTLWNYKYKRWEPRNPAADMREYVPHVFLWWNYKRKRWEYRNADTDTSEYIPQVSPALMMFKCYIELGVEPDEAALRVLAAYTGVDHSGGDEEEKW